MIATSAATNDEGSDNGLRTTHAHDAGCGSEEWENTLSHCYLS